MSIPFCSALFIDSSSINSLFNSVLSTVMVGKSKKETVGSVFLLLNFFFFWMVNRCVKSGEITSVYDRGGRVATPQSTFYGRQLQSLGTGMNALMLVNNLSILCKWRTPAFGWRWYLDMFVLFVTIVFRSGQSFFYLFI